MREDCELVIAVVGLFSSAIFFVPEFLQLFKNINRNDLFQMADIFCSHYQFTLHAYAGEMTFVKINFERQFLFLLCLKPNISLFERMNENVIEWSMEFLRQEVR